ncbi:MAG: aldehyde dehydrogenase family protein [FCB group bacterium]|nr:aldehyde dehydrogenase family protein [FCB group bacterium]
MQSIRALIERTKEASPVLASLDMDKRKSIINDMLNELDGNKEMIARLNKQDLLGGQAMRLSDIMIAELLLDEQRIASLVEKLRLITEKNISPCSVAYTGSEIHIIETADAVPVFALVYESRPYLTAEAAVMCFTSGRAVILRGGKEAFHTNTAIASIFCDVLEQHGLPRDLIKLIPTSDRVMTAELVQLDDLVDLVIPCGSEWLIQYVQNNSKIPVATNYKEIFAL